MDLSFPVSSKLEIELATQGSEQKLAYHSSNSGPFRGTINVAMGF
jgi:hypothetical protein